MSKPSHGATARLFVAVDPPPAVCRELAAWARAALGRPGVRLLGAETMHVTVCFLGGRPAGEIEAIAGALEECETEPLQLRVGAPLWLPPRNPRSLALEIHDRAGELQRLYASVCEALSGAIAWEPDRRRFRAHVTVARLGRVERGERGARGRRRRARSGEPSVEELGAGVETPLEPSPQLSFAPRELVLYRSQLSPEGASYEALATRALDAKAESSAAPSASSAGVGPTEALEATGTRQASIDPSAMSVGGEPSSHTGAEPSSQE